MHSGPRNETSSDPYRLQRSLDDSSPSRIYAPLPTWNNGSASASTLTYPRNAPLSPKASGGTSQTTGMAQQQQQQHLNQGLGGQQLNHGGMQQQQQQQQGPGLGQQQQHGGLAGNGLQPNGAPAANGGGSQDAASSSQPEYSLAGILHYLQSEWRRYEKDRNEWEIERAEMRARIALLEGERRAVENLKTDLMRRVKMLEYALRQERSKFLSSSGAQGTLKNPIVAGLEKDSNTLSSGRSTPIRLEESDPNIAAQRPNSTYATNTTGTSALGGVGGSAATGSTLGQQRGAKDGRSREKSRDYLKQCLQEIAYLTSATTLNPLPDRPTGSLLHGTGNQQGPPRPRKTLADESGPEGMARHMSGPGAQNAAGDVEQRAPADEGHNGGVAAAIEQRPASPRPFVINEETASEQVQRSEPPLLDFQPSGGPNDWRTEERNSSGAGQEDLIDASRQELNETSEKVQKLLRGGASNGTFEVGEGGSRSGMEDDALLEEAHAAMEESQSWKLKKTLALHKGSVKALAFDSVSLSLFTASDDHSVKMVRVDSIDGVSTSSGTSSAASVSRGSASRAVAFTGHTSAVTALVTCPSKKVLYSGSLDATLRTWRIPDGVEDHEQSSTPGDDSKLAGEQVDSQTVPSEITQMTLLPSPRGEDAILATASADGLVRLYSLEDESSKPALLFEFDYFGVDSPPECEAAREEFRAETGGLPVPTSICSIQCDLKLCAVSYSNSFVKIFEVASGKEMSPASNSNSEGATVSYGPLNLQGSRGDDPSSQPNACVSHPTLPLLFTGHEDKFLKVSHLHTRKCLASMHGHKDAVTSLDIDPAGLKLLSAGHDGALRIWEIVDVLKTFTDDGETQQEGAGAAGKKAAGAVQSQANGVKSSDEAAPDSSSTPAPAPAGEDDADDEDDEEDATLRLVQEIVDHHKTVQGEGVFVVRYHRTRPYFAAGGADGLVRIYG
ncbi:WD40 repeat-like protein [Microstroma glucosiphilum]|uniref:WD40 repeat-like protein n=1 Tax=Pseudomicrostroma glucosiphilum TaxID=1684307 RepID=A0A316U0A1_9BASI|nr:WD40 repeat-like protein [Pseudomicrostroma glucosiphilum]PWN17923.1 WD40 repeat-like protein [Pseudomicrostroma glucosiphilum]